MQRRVRKARTDLWQARIGAKSAKAQGVVLRPKRWFGSYSEMEINCPAWPNVRPVSLQQRA
jgi:hypothetical protein